MYLLNQNAIVMNNSLKISVFFFVLGFAPILVNAQVREKSCTVETANGALQGAAAGAQVGSTIGVAVGGGVGFLTGGPAGAVAGAAVGGAIGGATGAIGGGAVGGAAANNACQGNGGVKPWDKKKEVKIEEH